MSRENRGPQRGKVIRLRRSSCCVGPSTLTAMSLGLSTRTRYGRWTYWPVLWLTKVNTSRRRTWSGRRDISRRALGPDEFVIVLTGVKEVASAAVAADHLMKAMRTEFTVQGQVLNTTCSLGIGVLPDHGRDNSYQERGCRHLLRQGEWQEQLPVLHSGYARSGCGAADTGEQLAPSFREERTFP
jgi:hypothetical protein